MQWFTTLQKNMKLQNEIPKFLATKSLSENSRLSYSYDLNQFCAFFETHEMNEAGVLLFKKNLKSLSPAAQKRKVSADNQFLSFLYHQSIIHDFLQISKIDTNLKNTIKVEIPQQRDFSSFYGPIQTPGQFLATLILETGLTPSEICHLKWENFNWRFNLLEINKNGARRAIPLQNKFAVRAKVIQNADELFGKSRQYLHGELKKFTDFTARELREQFIMRKVKEGHSIYDLSELLGLKTIVTLEKYFKKLR